MDQSKVFSQGKEVYPKGGGTKGEIMVLGGRPSHHWMVVNIQASVSGFQLISIDIKWLNLSFLQIYACFDCVVINHQKGGDCKKNGPIRPLFCDFGD